jgi:hypothetical protein
MNRQSRRPWIVRTVVATTAAMLLLAGVAGTALGWTRPSLSAECAPDADHYAWSISLTREPDYLIQFSWSSTFSNAWVGRCGWSGG